MAPLYSPTAARTASPQQPLRLRQQRAAFSDNGHLAFYGYGAASAAGRPARRRTAAATPVAAAASGATSRRARVLQQVADVEATLLRLEQVGRVWWRAVVQPAWCPATAR